MPGLVETAAQFAESVAARAETTVPVSAAPVAPAPVAPVVPIAPSPRDARPPIVAVAEVSLASVPDPADPPLDPNRTTCTTAQLRRFIKSRPWIPMHELRRRFGIPGTDDDVTPVRLAATTIFVGMPQMEGQMLGELLVSGDVGYELSLDPITPIVIGVYPMRPVPRG